MKVRERIYIIPHWAGIILAVATFSIFVFGYFAHGFSGLPQILVISLVVAGIVVLIQSNENLLGVNLVSCRAAPVPAGGEALIEVTLRNSTTRDRLGLRVRFRNGWSLAGDGFLPVLKPGEMKTVLLRMPAGFRGRLPVPPVWVTSTLPAGLCFAWKIFSDTGELFVYPKPAGEPLASAFPGLRGSGTGVRKGADDISGHRPYAAGDLLTRLDWRVFARSGKLVVKTFEGVGTPAEVLRWEDTAFLQDHEARLEQLSFWVSECAMKNEPFELQLDPASRFLNEKNLAACRIALATFPAAP